MSGFVISKDDPRIYFGLVKSCNTTKVYIKKLQGNS